MSRKPRGSVLFALIVSVALAVAAGVGLRAFDTQVSFSHGPTGYRGIVAANFYSADAGEEIIGDFGTTGVWLYHHFSQWVRLTWDNPEWIFAVKFDSTVDSELVADFGSLGLWLWDCCSAAYSGTWTRLTSANPENAIAVDDDWDGREELEVDFGTLGLWRYDHDTYVWSRLSALDPVGSGLRTDLWDVGWQEGLWNFGDVGLWLVFWDEGTYVVGPYWQQISPASADDRAAGNFVDSSGTGPQEELAVEFPGLGVWQFDSSRTWVQLTASSVQAMVPAKFGDSTDTEVMVADSSYTPWCWWGGSTWERLSYTPLETGFLVPYEADYLASGEPASEQELVGDFGAAGLWEYNYIAQGGQIGVWRRLSAANPVFMVAADHWGDGRQTTAVVNFGPGVGLWIWYGGEGFYTPFWTKMTDAVPDSNMSW